MVTVAWADGLTQLVCYNMRGKHACILAILSKNIIQQLISAFRSTSWGNCRMETIFEVVMAEEWAWYGVKKCIVIGNTQFCNILRNRISEWLRNILQGWKHTNNINIKGIKMLQNEIGFSFNCLSILHKTLLQKSTFLIRMSSLRGRHFQNFEMLIISYDNYIYTELVCMM